MKKVLDYVKRKEQLFKLFLITSALFFAVAFFYYHNSFPQGDEPHYLVISQTLLKYHSVYVMKDYTNHDYYSFYPWPINFQVEKVGNSYLSQRRIGAPVLWLPFYALWGRLGAIFFVSFLSVLTVINIFLLLRVC